MTDEILLNRTKWNWAILFRTMKGTSIKSHQPQKKQSIMYHCQNSYGRTWKFSSTLWLHYRTVNQHNWSTLGTHWSWHQCCVSGRSHSRSFHKLASSCELWTCWDSFQTRTIWCHFLEVMTLLLSHMWLLTRRCHTGSAYTIHNMYGQSNCNTQINNPHKPYQEYKWQMNSKIGSYSKQPYQRYKWLYTPWPWQFFRSWHIDQHFVVTKAKP